MKNVIAQGARVPGAATRDRESVLFVGVGQFGTGVEFGHLGQFSLADSPIEVKSIATVRGHRELESTHAPVVVVLGLNEQSTGLVEAMRQVWPNTAIIIAAPEGRMADVYHLLARGAVDYISLNASKSEIQEKCILRIGCYRARVTEGSRTLGRLTINLMQRTVTNGNETASLTPIEIKIVTTLADSLGGVVQRNAMKQMCWGDTEITDNALNRKIYEVRRTLRKLSEDVNIRTIYGLGFELSVRGESSGV